MLTTRPSKSHRSRVPWQPATGRRGGRGECPSPNGRRTGGVQLTKPHVERQPPVPYDEAEPIPYIRVLDAHVLVCGLEPHKNADAHG